MLRLQYSLRTLLIASTLLALVVSCFAIVNNRARNQWIVTQEIVAAGGEVFFSAGDADIGIAHTSASTSNYFPHLYQSIEHVTLYPDIQNPIQNQISTAAKIPRLMSLSIYPDTNKGWKHTNRRSPNGVSNADIEAIAYNFPYLREFYTASATCELQHAKWLEFKLQLESGVIFWRLDAEGHGRNYPFDKYGQITTP